MTERPAHVYTARPADDGSGLWVVVHNESGQEIMRGSEKVCKAKVGLNVDYDAQGVGNEPRKGKT